MSAAVGGWGGVGVGGLSLAVCTEMQAFTKEDGFRVIILECLIAASELQHRGLQIHQLDILLKHMRVISWLNESSNYPVLPRNFNHQPLTSVLERHPGINPQDILMILPFCFLKPNIL